MPLSQSRKDVEIVSVCGLEESVLGCCQRNFGEKGAPLLDIPGGHLSLSLHGRGDKTVQLKPDAGAYRFNRTKKLRKCGGNRP